MNKEFYNVYIFYDNFDRNLANSVLFVVVNDRLEWGDCDIFNIILKHFGTGTNFVVTRFYQQGPKHGFIFPLGNTPDEIAVKEVEDAAIQRTV